MRLDVGSAHNPVYPYLIHIKGDLYKEAFC